LSRLRIKGNARVVFRQNKSSDWHPILFHNLWLNWFDLLELFATGGQQAEAYQNGAAAGDFNGIPSGFLYHV